MRRALGALTGALIFAGAAGADDYKIGALTIEQPWTRATPGGAQVAGGYMKIVNSGSEPDRLVGVSSPIAARGELHEMAVQGGVMTMRPLPQGVEIGSGRSVSLKPSGLHIMFTELKAPVKQGERVPATLEFARAGKLNVEFQAEAVGAREPSSAHGRGAAHGPAPGGTGSR